MTPPNLSVRIGKLTLRNPVTTGSGTFGFGSEMAEIVDLSRVGAICVKATTRHARTGNPPARIVETPSGMLNADRTAKRRRGKLPGGKDALFAHLRHADHRERARRRRGRFRPCHAAADETRTGRTPSN
jgi:hypothetical protein